MQIAHLNLYQLDIFRTAYIICSLFKFLLKFHVTIHKSNVHVLSFADQVKSQNGKVLVHCQAGVSRSATICIAYLMATRRLRMEEAYKYVKSRRRIVSPNFSFMGQLLTFENQIFSGSSFSRYISSPGSPLLAVDASTPDPDSLTPSRSATHKSVFNFMPLSSVEDALSPSIVASENEFTKASNSIVDTCHKLTLSPCLT